jgi:hypothetical protein
MKMSLYFCIYLIAIFGCSPHAKINEQGNPHDIENALRRSQVLCRQNTMVWFSDMLRKAEEDRISNTHKGNYIGIISIIYYKSQPVIYTDFALGSGGVAFYLFDCNGNPVSCQADEATKLPGVANERKNIIYASLNE